MTFVNNTRTTNHRVSHIDESILFGKSIGAMLFAALVLSAPLFGANIIIEDFEGGVEHWQVGMPYGQVSRCKSSTGEGVGGSQGLQVEYHLEAKGTNHILFGREVDLDLSGAAGISVQVRGTGDTTDIYLFLFDSQGRFNNYGPHGSNGDFHTGYADWYTCQVNLDEDRSAQGGNVDFHDIKRIGFFVWGMGPKHGTVWFDNLGFREPQASVRVSPQIISPNGDGIYDTATIKAVVPRDTSLTMRVVDAKRKPIATLAKDLSPARRRVKLTWDGLAKGQALDDGQYTILAHFRGAMDSVARAQVTIDTTYECPPLKYQTEPFFPIGVWFEGAPGLATYPSDPIGAREYYDRCFADLAAHSFNAAVVPNCPEHLWETLLQSAHKHGIRVVLEVAPLVGLVSQEDPIRESEAHSIAKRIVEKVGKYDSLARYQVRDEPPSWMIPNWVAVQRILAAVDPTRPAFSCFCAPDSLALLASSTHLSEAVFGRYPHSPGTPLQTLGDFLPCLDSFKSASRGAPLWGVLGAFAQADAWRYPTPEELRAVTYLSLSAGAKGVFYFIYQYMPKYLDGMVKPDGTPLPIYATATALAQELQKLSPLLLSLTAAEPPPEIRGDVRVGSFVDEAGHPVLIIASTRPDKKVTARIKLDKTGGWRDVLSGEVFTPRGRLLIVPLAPGGGRALVCR